MSAEVAVVESAHGARFDESLAAEHAAERGLFAAIVKSIAIALPVMIGIFVLMTAIAMSDKTEWYVWLSVAVGLGVVGAMLLGSLAGATLSADRLDAVDRATYD
jgi:uncharacterized membrane protein AbrB (regulator of aidB expression)